MPRRTHGNDRVSDLIATYWRNIDDQDYRSTVGLKRTASYARFSSEGQKESSIERQDASILAYGKRVGFHEVPAERRFVDRGKSGSTVQGRNGLKAMLELARIGAFDVLIVEDLDRLSRDMADLAVIAKELKRLGIEIHAATYGRVSDIHVAFYGLLGMEQRLTLLRRTSLGRWMAAMRGSNPVGKAYGYRKGRQRGRLRIKMNEAEVIRRIFEWFAEGLSARQIVIILNSQGIPAPKGGLWNELTIKGVAANGSGILRNPKYVGVLVFGRTETVHPIEGSKRSVRIRPKAQWVYCSKKNWQIVSRRLWVAVQMRLAEEAKAASKRRADATLPVPREKRSTKSVDLFHGS